MELKRAIVTGALVGILLAAFLVLPSFSSTVQATQYSPPWADRFTTSYPPPDATTYNADWLTEMGAYRYNAHSWVNPIAKFVTNSKMPADAVISTFGHGNKGYAFFWNAVYGTTCIRADAGMSWPSGVNKTWSSSLNEASDLWDVRLWMIEGCYTACRKDSNYDYTSLTEQAVKYKGVDCAVGFTTTIYSPQANWWDYMFWYKMANHGVQNSCIVATQQVYLKYGDRGGTQNYAIQGNAGIWIVPAAYGT
jgi:hypothetical protein